MITNKVIVVAAFFTAALMTVIVVIFIYLAWKRYRMQHKEQWMLMYIERSTTDWFNYLINGERLPKQAPHKYLNEAIDRIFLSYNLTLKGLQMNDRITSYAEMNMKKYYEKQLSSNDWAVRVNVLRRIVLFKLHFLVTIVVDKLKKGDCRTKEEYMVMLRIASIYDEALFLAHMVKPKIRLYEYDYKMVLSQVSHTYHQEIMDRFDEFPVNMQLAFLDYLSYQTSLNQQSLQFFEMNLQSMHKEFRIKALKAVHSFGMVSSLKLYEQFVASEEWEERLMFTKILRFIATDEAYRLLNVLICDSNYDVRKQAAETLKGKKGGEMQLRNIMEQQDRFAADMAKEVLIMR